MVALEFLFFFVISGFLITSLLLRELGADGQIRLGRFYVRRAFRIFPPLYAYLTVVGILGLARVTAVDWRSFLSAATYTWNYYIHGQGWVFGHLGSLSLEEQFYLLWPHCLVLFNKRICLRIATAAVFLSPVSRIATYLLFPDLRGHTGMMLHTSVDTIMIGCVLALVIHMNLWTEFLRRVTRIYVILAAVVFPLFLNSLLTVRFRGTYSLTVGMSLQGICCGVVLLYAITHPDNALGKSLNHPLVRHVGIISYSLYLWQQLFSLDGMFSSFLWQTVSLFACAEASYFVIEKPSSRLRDKVLALVADRKMTIVST